MKLSFSTRGRLNTPWNELTRLALENGKKVQYKFNYGAAEKAIERLSK